MFNLSSIKAIHH